MSSGSHSALGPTRERLLQAAKQLFAEKGFENASTVAIARAAATSESQLVKHFGSKEGLLEAIFEDSWEQIGKQMRSLASLPTPAEKLRTLLETIVDALDRDPQLKQLMLLEGRRIRKEGGLFLLTQGFMNFVKTVDGVLGEMKAAGQLRPDVTVEAARSALMGMFEGMMRDQVLGRRVGFPAPFSTADVRRMFGLMVQALGKR